MNAGIVLGDGAEINGDPTLDGVICSCSGNEG